MIKLKSVVFSAVAVVSLTIASPAWSGLFGPPKFTVTQSDDRFSADGATTYTGHWNRISKKSLAGGVHIDSSGVYVEPMAIKDRASGRLLRLEFFVHNELSEDSAGVGQALAFGELQRITFLADGGAPIALAIGHSERDQVGPTTYNSVSRMASTEVTETGFSEVLPADFQRIMNAQTLLAKIEGSKRNMVYEAKDISKSFQQNLRTFWSGYVAGTGPK